MLFVLADAAAAALLVHMGLDMATAFSAAGTVLVMYAYVLYKRFHVEVVPESDIALFTDSEDLRILCRIYGLDDTGKADELRRRLRRFARENSARAFTWVAPRTVLALGSALALEGSRPGLLTARRAPGLPSGILSEAPKTHARLIGSKTRYGAHLSALSACPVCDSAVRGSDGICGTCGADLEFYTVLQESKIGRRMLSMKGSAVRRKLRYDVPSLRRTV